VKLNVINKVYSLGTSWKFKFDMKRIMLTLFFGIKIVHRLSECQLQIWVSLWLRLLAYLLTLLFIYRYLQYTKTISIY